MPASSDHSTQLDRKSLKRPDRVTQGLQGAFQGLTKNSRVLAGLGVALLILAALATWIVQQRETKAQEAREALYQARQTAIKELEAIAASQPKKPEAAQPKADPKAPPQEAQAPTKPDISGVLTQKFDVDAKMPETVKKLTEVAKNYSSTRSGYEARLALGDLYYNHGQPEKSVSWYEDASKAADAGFEKALAFYSLGYAQENSGKHSDAIQTYEKALALNEDAMKGDLLIAVARCYEAVKDVPKARSTYDQIIAQMPNTEHAKTAEMRKSQL